MVSTPSLIIVFALICEVLAVVLFCAPGGLLPAVVRGDAGLLRAALVVGGTAGATVFVRTILPGAKAWSLFVRPGGTSFPRTLYYGILAATLLTFYRAAWLVALNFAGTPFVATLSGVGRGGPWAPLAPMLLSLAGCYLFFGYVLATAGEAAGRRAGIFVAATLAALAAVWPPLGPSRALGEYSWQLFVAWRLPEALALAWLTERTRTVLAPLVAVFLMTWFAAFSELIFAVFGKWPLLFACVVVLLSAAEVALTERRRLGRAVRGFASLLTTRAELMSFFDGLLLAAAFAGVYVAGRGAFTRGTAGYVCAVIIAGIFGVGVVLGFGGRRRLRAEAGRG